jgi:hypothetical protein
LLQLQPRQAKGVADTLFFAGSYSRKEKSISSVPIGVICGQKALHLSISADQCDQRTVLISLSSAADVSAEKRR